MASVCGFLLTLMTQVSPAHCSGVVVTCITTCCTGAYQSIQWCQLTLKDSRKIALSMLWDCSRQCCPEQPKAGLRRVEIRPVQQGFFFFTTCSYSTLAGYIMYYQTFYLMSRINLCAESEYWNVYLFSFYWNGKSCYMGNITTTPFELLLLVLMCKTSSWLNLWIYLSCDWLDVNLYSHLNILTFLIHTDRKKMLHLDVHSRWFCI